MTEPLTADDVEIFRHAGRINDRLDALLTAATPLVARTKDGRLEWAHYASLYQNFRPAPGDGFAARRAPTSVSNSRPTRTGACDDPTSGTAHAGAGYGLPHTYYDAVQVALADHELHADGFTLYSEEGEDVLVFASRPLSDLVTPTASVRIRPPSWRAG